MTGTLRLLVLPVALAAGLSACERTTPSQTDQATPANASQSGMVVSKGALQPKNEAQPVTEANNIQTPAAPVAASQEASAQQTPSDFIAHYAALLQAHNFGEAYKLLDPSMGITEQQFEKRLSGYKTIQTAVGNIGPVEGAAGSLYDTVQLTLTGEKTDGTPYKVTGPVTLRRVNDVPGSTPEQRQWHIYKMDLSSNAKTQQP
jgi:hypothetical protein